MRFNLEMNLNDSEVQDERRRTGREGEDEGLPSLIPVVVGLSVLAVLSQMPVLAISRGLESGSSGRVFLGIQAVFEMLKRFLSVVRPLLVTIVKNHTFLNESSIPCRIMSFSDFFFMVTPEWVSSLVALDRLIAVCEPNWYRTHGTPGKAYGATVLFTVLLLSIGTPKLIFVEKKGRGTCVLGHPLIESLLGYVGGTGALIGGVLTVILLVMRKVRAKNTNARATDVAVNKALTINCCLFTVCAVIQYGLLSLQNEPYARRYRLRGIGNIAGSLGVLVRAPIYLYMPPMRKAFVQGLKCKK